MRQNVFYLNYLCLNYNNKLLTCLVFEYVYVCMYVCVMI